MGRRSRRGRERRKNNPYRMKDLEAALPPSDEEIIEALEYQLRGLSPNTFISFDELLQQVQSDLGFDLSSKVDFICDRINLFYESHPLPPPLLLVPHLLPNYSGPPIQSVPPGTKTKVGHPGLNRLYGVSPELETIVGKPALSRPEIFEQLWAYLRRNKLQDPTDQRKIICNDELRLVFETDCTDMYRMNELVIKHVIPLPPSSGSTA